MLTPTKYPAILWLVVEAAVSIGIFLKYYLLAAFFRQAYTPVLTSGDILAQRMSLLIKKKSPVKSVNMMTVTCLNCRK